MFGRSRLPLKSSAEIVAMRRAGLVTGSALRAAATATAPGMTTAEIDAVAREHILGADAVPSFLGYQGFPATLCISVNDEVVHGIPGERVVREGDVVSLDCGAVVDGWHGDSALSFVVGAESSDPASATRVVARHAGLEGPLGIDDLQSCRREYGEAAGLIVATELSMCAGIRAIAAEKRLNGVGAAIEEFLRAEAPAAGGGDYEIVDGYTGHGVGRALHEDPTVYNEAVRERLPRVRTGLVVAVEPMVTLGTYETHELEDGWTVKTDDGSLAAHFEHTTAVTDGGLWVLTAEDGGRSLLGDLYAPLAD